MLPTISGSTVISQEQLVPAGYFLSGQLGVMISPWAFVIFPPQNSWSETSRTHSIRLKNEDNSKLFSKKYAKYRCVHKFFLDNVFLTFRFGIVDHTVC